MDALEPEGRETTIRPALVADEPHGRVSAVDPIPRSGPSNGPQTNVEAEAADDVAHAESNRKSVGNPDKADISDTLTEMPLADQSCQTGNNEASISLSPLGDTQAAHQAPMIGESPVMQIGVAVIAEARDAHSRKTEAPVTDGDTDDRAINLLAELSSKPEPEPAAVEAAVAKAEVIRDTVAGTTEVANPVEEGGKPSEKSNTSRDGGSD